MQSITNETFEEEVIRSEIPVLLEFYSDSCIPCKRMSPVLAELEEKYNNIKFAKLNINFGAETAKQYGVMSSPVFLFFKKGEEITRVKGIVKQNELEKMINEVVK